MLAHVNKCTGGERKTNNLRIKSLWQMSYSLPLFSILLTQTDLIVQGNYFRLSISPVLCVSKHCLVYYITQFREAPKPQQHKCRGQQSMIYNKPFTGIIRLGMNTSQCSVNFVSGVNLKFLSLQMKILFTFSHRLVII